MVQVLGTLHLHEWEKFLALGSELADGNGWLVDVLLCVLPVTSRKSAEKHQAPTAQQIKAVKIRTICGAP